MKTNLTPSPVNQPAATAGTARFTALLTRLALVDARTRWAGFDIVFPGASGMNPTMLNKMVVWGRRPRDVPEDEAEKREARRSEKVVLLDILTSVLFLDLPHVTPVAASASTSSKQASRNPPPSWSKCERGLGFYRFLSLSAMCPFLFGLILSGAISVGVAVESGQIISVSHSEFTGGQSTTVTVLVRNTGDSDDMVIEAYSKPSGWTISPTTVTPYMTSGTYYNAQFTVTAPTLGGSGTIVWKFYDDDIGVHPAGSDLLATFNQSVNASGAPTVPTTPGTPDLSSISDTGKYSTDNITSDNTPTFFWSGSSDSGSGVAGYEYKLGNGSWISIGDVTSHTLPSLSDGGYTIYVRARNNAGNVSSSSPGLTFVIDRTPPGPPSQVSPPNGGSVTDVTPTLFWYSAGDANGIWKYHLEVEEAFFFFDVVNRDVTGTSYMLSGAEALEFQEDYNWRVYAVDTAGNVGNYSSSWGFDVGSSLSLAINSSSITEGDGGTMVLQFAVTLSQTSPDIVTVSYATSDGTASGGVDYAAKSGTLSFLPGDLSKSIYVTVNGDYLIEANETFTVTLSNPSNATISDGTGTGTIQNDDALPAVSYPASLTVIQGSNAMFSVIASGKSPRFTWTNATVPVINGGRISGATTPNLLIAAVLAADEGDYFVTVSDATGVATSDPATLTVHVPPFVVQGPQSQTVPPGVNVTFTVTGGGKPTPAYQWFKDGVALDGQTGTNLMLNGVQAVDQGAYTVVLTNLMATNVPGIVTSMVANLTVVVQTPVFLAVQGSGTAGKTPVRLLYDQGEPVTLTATNGRYATFSHWLSNGVVAVSSANYPISVGRSNHFTAVFTNNMPLEHLVVKQWEIACGGTGSDGLAAVLPLSDGGYLLGGSSWSGPSGNRTAVNFGFNDFWVIRIDAQGNKLWDRVYGGTDQDFLRAMLVTPDGGFLLAGRSASDISGNKSALHYGLLHDLWVVKIDGNGDKQWDASFGGTASEELVGLAASPDGSACYLGGHSDSQAGTGNKTATSYGDYDLWVVKIDSAGNKIWDNSFGGAGSDQGGVVVATESGLLLGATSPSLPGPGKSSPNYGSSDLWIVQTDIHGTKQWEKTFGGTGVDSLSDLRQTRDGGFILGGVAYSGADGNKQSSSHGGADYWVLRIDAMGNKLWERAYGGSGSDTLLRVAEAPNGDFILAGDSDSPSSGSKTANSFGAEDFWLIRIDFQGNELWQTNFGGFQSDYLGLVAYGSPDRLLVGGTSLSGAGGNKSSGSYGGSDGWIIALADREAPVGMPLIKVNDTFEPSGGYFFGNSADVAISSTFPDLLISYTLDGSDPSFFLNSNAIYYDGPFTVNNTVTLRTFAYNLSTDDSIEGNQVSLTVLPTFELLISNMGGTVSNDPSANSYISNSVVTLHAVPSNGWTFLNWEGDASEANNPVSVVVNGPKSIRAVFGTPVTVAPLPGGSGVVHIQPTVTHHAFNSVAHFTPVPNTTHFFFGWGGSVSGTNNPLTLTVTNTQPSFFAVFAPLPPGEHTLTVIESEGGSVNRDPMANKYASDTPVTLTATPLAGHRFSGWSRSDGVTSTTNPLVLTMDSSLVVTGLFQTVSPPIIVGQPSDATVLAGSNANFTVGAAGAAIGFQWRLHGTNLSGATSSNLLINSAVAVNSGPYDVVVSNPGGSITSTVAKLRVITLDNIRDDFWVTDGPVHTVAAAGGVVYAGGEFRHVAPVAGGLALVSTSDGVVQKPFPRVSGEVYAVVSDGVGGWFIGGNFTHVGGLTRGFLAHILTNGSVDASWTPTANGSVNAMALDGGRLYVGGGFFNLGGANRRGLAALDADTGAVLDWNPVANDAAQVQALAVGGDGLFVGGVFSTMGGASRQNLAKVNLTTGAAVADWIVDADSSVNALWYADGFLYVGGGFQQIGPGLDPPVRLARVVDATHTVDDSWKPNPNNAVRALALSGSTLYVGGSFLNVGLSTRRYLAAVDLTNGAPTAWNPDPNHAVWSILVNEGVVYVGGDFTQVGGEDRNCVVALGEEVSAQGNYVIPWNAKVGGRTKKPAAAVRALATHGSRLVLGGTFAVAGRVERPYLAAFDAVSGSVKEWNAGLDNVVEALALGPGVVYAGGRFTQAGEESRNRIAALDAATGAATTWNPDANGDVYALVMAGNEVYAGGQFTSIGRQPRLRLAALSTVGNGDATTWTADVTGPDAVVNALAVDGQLLYVGGNFTHVSTVERACLAALSRRDDRENVFPSWNPAPNSFVESLAVEDGVLYVSGNFMHVGGQPRTHVAALTGASLNGGGTPTSWIPNTSGLVTALAAFQGRVYAGGLFSSIGRQGRQNFALLDNVNGDASAFNVAADGSVHGLAVSTGTVYLGGEFTKLAGRSVGHLGVLGPDGPPAFLGQILSLTPRRETTLALNAPVFGQGPLFYQWRRNGVAVAEATDVIFLLSNVNIESNGIYSVVVSNQLGVITNNVASVSVGETPEFNVAEDATIPVRPVGNSIELTVTATGSEPFTFEWRLNGREIMDKISNVVIASNRATSTLMINNAMPTNSGSYTVTVRNPFGAEESDPIGVVVSSAANVVPFLDDFAYRREISGSVGYAVGDNLTATMEDSEPQHAGRTSGASVWLKWVAPRNGVVTFTTAGSGIDTVLAIYTTNNVAGTALNSLQQVVADDDSGGFATSQVSFNATNGVEYAIAIAGFGSAIGNIVLSWDLNFANDDIPRIVKQPSDQTATNRFQTVTFKVDALNRQDTTEGITYQWRRHGQAIPGETNATLTVQVESLEQSFYASYVCDVTIGERKERTYPAVLERNETKSNGIDVSTTSARSKEKFNELFEIDEALSPNVKRVGRRVGKQGAGFGLVVGPGTVGTQILGNIGSTRELFEPIVGGRGSGNSRWFALEAQSAGTMIVDTDGSEADTVMAVYIGDSLTTLTPVASDSQSAPDETNALVSFPAVAGQSYLIAVDSEHGKTGLIKLNFRMGEPVAINQPPASLTVKRLRESATFSVAAGGDPVPTYQWQRNGEALPGATNAVLTLPNVGLGDAGSYSVVVSNLLNVSVSGAAQLVVTDEESWFDSFTLLSGSGLRLQGHSPFHKPLILEVAPDLSVPIQWTPIYTNDGSLGSFDFTDPGALGLPLRFYRIIRLP